MATKQTTWFETQQRIMALTGITHKQYCWGQYNLGIAYLKHYIGNDETGIDFLVRTKAYWTWWRNQWAIREQMFLQTSGNTFANKETLLRIWKSMHKPHNITATPNQLVLEESYSLMIAEVWKEASKKEVKYA